ncbi:MAG: M28 family peptidase [Chitinivibrionales bacterium]|nr:M28 family peptidase [Chitinivibrionales bacterium]
MVRCIAFLTLLISITTVFSQKSLILVQNLGELKYQVPVLEIVEQDNFLVLAQQRDIDLLSRNHASYSLLEENVTTDDYFLVFPFKATPDQSVPFDPKVFASYGTVLATFNTCLLIRSTDDRLGRITEYSTQLDHLELEPLEFNLNNTIIDLNTSPHTPNPQIQEMLTRVNKDSCDRFERDLTGMHNRDLKAQYNAQLMLPYLKAKLKAYGCDSIIELPITSGTTIAGVRFGTKDKTIKQFVLVGGHPDTKSTSTSDRHQGANDNTSGTVGVLETARVHQFYTFEYSLIYAFFNGEEYGLYGSAKMMPELKKAGCKVIGGCWNYDMIGLWGTTFGLNVKPGIAGGEEFIAKINEINKQYNTGAINVKSKDQSSTDIVHIWNNGFCGVSCDFSNAGLGIHNPKDSLNNQFKPEWIATASKTGIAVTAYYASISGSTANTQVLTHPKKNAVVTYSKSAPHQVTFTIAGVKSTGTVSIYDLHGKLVENFAVYPATSGPSKIIWNNPNTVSNALYLVQYTDSRSTVALTVCVF